MPPKIATPNTMVINNFVMFTAITQACRAGEAMVSAFP